MANINVSYQEMRDAALRLSQGKEDMTTKLTELDTLVNNLVASGYITEQSSVAFDQSFDQFIIGTKQAVEGLEGLSKYLIAAAEALESTDAGLAKSISGQ